jgi:hypothetical protein
MKLVIFALFFCSSASVLLLMCQRRIAAGSGLGTGLGITIKKV